MLGAPKGFADDARPAAAEGEALGETGPRDRSLSVLRAQAGASWPRSSRRWPASIDRQTLWMVWPKQASGINSDLNGNIVRETGLASGWVDFKICSIDDTWSGLAFKRRR